MELIWASIFLIAPWICCAEPNQSNDKIAPGFQSHFSWKEFQNLKYRQEAEFINSLSAHDKFEFLKIYLPKSHCEFPGGEILWFHPDGQLILLASTEDNKTRRLAASWKIEDDKLTLRKNHSSDITMSMGDLEVWTDLTADYDHPPGEEGSFIEMKFKVLEVRGDSVYGHKLHYVDQNILCD